MLVIKNLETHYGNIRALKGISLEIKKGEIVTLIGANGAGKTTTLKTISGLIKPTRGTITYEGQEISGKAPDAIVQMGISQVPEGRRVFTRLTVLENLEMGAYARRDQEIGQDMDKVFGLFPILKERQRQPAGTLSGGEQQMLAIGRALMARPKLLLLDEPSMGLAPLIVRTIFNIIQNINAQGTTILLVEQNAHLALSVADRGYVLETGQVQLADEAKKLLNDPRVRKAYLGD